MILPAGSLNRVYLPHMTDETRYQIYFGGAASGKSVFLATRCVLDAMQGRNILVARKVARTLRGSCWNECLKAVSRLNIAEWFRINKSDMTLTAKNNGCQILFAGLDDVEKTKSITPVNGPLTDIWIEEATECERDDFKQLDKRLRGISPHAKRLTLSFNPVYKTHWIFSEFFGIWEDGKQYARSGNVGILKTTYKDNRFLAADDRAAMENETDPYFREVYTLGNWGVLGDVIFHNWRTEDLRSVEPKWPQVILGLDFGFASDPAAAVRAAYDRAHGRVFVFDEIYRKGLVNEELAEVLKPFAGGRYITCDSAEPKSIEELRRCGVKALAAKKGKDSVLHGIQWLQGKEIIIDTRCLNLKNELTLYQWKKDKDGASLPIPEDRNNHLIDAMRYALEEESTRRVAEVMSKRGFLS